MMKSPKLSIITINRNNRAGLEKTIRSVVEQSFRDVEYIVIDGASTDGSVEVIQQYADQIDYWVSEPDTGIYNAMNKGIKVAKGEYLLFLNSGDMLAQHSSLQDLFNFSFSEDIIYTNCFFLKEANLPLQKKKFPEPKNLTFSFFWGDMICHQATLFKRSFLESYSYYDEKFKLASDLKLVIMSIVYGKATLRKVDIYLSIYDLNGQSATNRCLYEEEKKKIFEEDFSFFVEDYKSYEKVNYELKAIRSHFAIKFWKRLRSFFRNLFHSFKRSAL